MLDCMSKSIVSRSREVVILLHSTLVQLHLEHCGFTSGPQQNSDKYKSEQAQQQVTAIVKSLEQLMYKQMLKELCLCSLEKRRLQVEHRNSLPFLKGSLQRGWNSTLLRVAQRRATADASCNKRNSNNLWGKKSTVRVTWTGCPEKLWNLHPWRYSELS